MLGIVTLPSSTARSYSGIESRQRILRGPTTTGHSDGYAPATIYLQLMRPPLTTEQSRPIAKLDAALAVGCGSASFAGGHSRELAGPANGSLGLNPTNRLSSSISLRDLRYAKPRMLGINVRFSGTSSRVGDLAIKNAAGSKYTAGGVFVLGLAILQGRDRKRRQGGEAAMMGRLKSMLR